jgi:hypothetical protein
VALLASIAGVPWVVKPLYGFISDSVPLLGYRRRSYLVLCGLLSASSWAALGTVVDSTAGAVAAMVAGSLGTAFSDVVVDSIVVERARGEPAATAGALQSLCWGSAAVGGIISAYWSGALVQEWGPRPVFLLTAALPLIVSCAALLIEEQPVARGYRRLSGSGAGEGGFGAHLLTQGRALWRAAGTRAVLLPTLFVFLWQATPSAESAMFYFYTERLHFTPEFLGRVRLAGSLASLAGASAAAGQNPSLPRGHALAAARG